MLCAVMYLSLLAVPRSRLCSDNHAILPLVGPDTPTHSHEISPHYTQNSQHYMVSPTTSLLLAPPLLLLGSLSHLLPLLIHKLLQVTEGKVPLLLVLTIGLRHSLE